MSKSAKTKAFIIESTATLFNRQGYAGTSLTDITKATGLTKGSIYGNFANKEAIAIAVFEYNLLRINKGLQTVISTRQSPLEKLVAYIDYFKNNCHAMFELGGCPVMNASVEADDNLPFLRQYVQKGIASWISMISHIIIEGQETGAFIKNLSAESYAYAIITLIEGGMMLGKILGDEAHLQAAADRALRIVDEELSCQ